MSIESVVEGIKNSLRTEFNDDVWSIRLWLLEHEVRSWIGQDIARGAENILDAVDSCDQNQLEALNEQVYTPTTQELVANGVVVGPDGLRPGPKFDEMTDVAKFLVAMAVVRQFRERELALKRALELAYMLEARLDERAHKERTTKR